jgi:hypothetical protein
VQRYYVQKGLEENH